MIKTSLTAAALAMTVASANAMPGSLVYGTTYNGLETSVYTPRAAGTIASGGSLTGGGLCDPTTYCPGTGSTLAITSGGNATTAGEIALPTVPGAPGDNYLLSVKITGYSALTTGDIYDALLSGSTFGTGTSMGTSSIVSISGTTGGTVSIIVQGGTSGLSLSFTDLLEEYASSPAGVSDTLPGYLNSADAGLNGGTVTSNGYQNSEFSILVKATYAPEPASIGLFLGGLAALGALTRRNRPSA